MANYICIEKDHYEQRYWQFLCKSLKLPEETKSIVIELKPKMVESYEIEIEGEKYFSRLFHCRSYSKFSKEITKRGNFFFSLKKENVGVLD